MSKQTTFDRVKTLIIDVLGSDEEAVTPSADIIDDLWADSLDLVELLMALEEEFGIEITDDEAETLGTVGDVVALIDRKLVEAA